MSRRWWVAVSMLALAACGTDHGPPPSTTPGAEPPAAGQPPAHSALEGGPARGVGPDDDGSSTTPGEGFDGADTCDASGAQWALGEVEPDPTLLGQAAADAGATSVRILRPGEVVTMEYHFSRLNLEVDEDGIVREVRCG